MTISDRIEKIRKNENLSQVEFAKKLNLSKQTISNYETGARQPGLDIILKIADTFDISTDYLLGRSEITNIAKISLADILTEKLALSNESVDDMINLFDQYFRITALSISPYLANRAELKGAIENLGVCIDSLDTYIVGSFQEIQIENKWKKSLLKGHSELSESYRLKYVDVTTAKTLFLMNFHQSLDNYIRNLQNQCRVALESDEQ